jgi:nitroimidazol reductase NimA-like FMN-containing flavoprotein (pyridoxamine 5'-phosphate oxidase superfamily)
LLFGGFREKIDTGTRSAKGRESLILEEWKMFREMRRKRQALPEDACDEILRRNTSGVLAVSGDDGWPYAVPLSYVYADGKIYFHSAAAGHKLDAIAGENRVSFCVVDEDKVVPGEYTTYFRSVIAFGRARVLEDPAEKRAAFELLAAKYTPDDEAGRKAEIDRFFQQARLVEIAVEHLSGKEAIEFVKARSREQGQQTL